MVVGAVASIGTGVFVLALLLLVQWVPTFSAIELEDCEFVVVTSVGGSPSQVRWRELQYAITMNAAVVKWKCMVIHLDGEALIALYRKTGARMFQFPMSALVDVAQAGWWNEVEDSWKNGKNTDFIATDTTTTFSKLYLYYISSLRHSFFNVRNQYLHDDHDQQRRPVPPPPPATVENGEIIFGSQYGNSPIVVLRNSQATYKELMEFINHHVKANQPVALLNADVHLDAFDFRNLSFDMKEERMLIHVPSYVKSTLEVANDGKTKRKHRFLALSRHPFPLCFKDSGGGANPQLPTNLCTGKLNGHVVSSADAFLFTSPFRGNTSELNYVPNLHGAENRLAWVAMESGEYTLENPCKYLRIYHVHCADRDSRAARGSFRVDTEGRTTVIARTFFKGVNSNT
eukprot:m.37005 g.37005  ORF g.37005 m.37005 type:complete len:401 (+) comp6712_c0_seq2:87-1289(+)